MFILEKPYAPACDKNKKPILDVLKKVFDKPCEVVEVGSGTGQHAVYFAENLPHLIWQPTDQSVYLSGISLWVDAAGLKNIRAPLELDVRQNDWPVERVEALFSANTLHIMSWKSVEIFYERLGCYLQSGAKFCSYGPFNINGQFTSESNATFDQWLKERDPLSGIRDLEALVALGEKVGLILEENRPLPANNRLLVWRKS